MRGLRLAAGLLGLAGAAVILWGVAASIPGFRGYSPLRHFISLLADPYNPIGHRLNAGFLLGGALAGLGLAAVALRAPPGPDRAAGWWGASAGFALALVGRYPLTAEVPHLVFAAMAGVCTTTATWLAARAARIRAAAAADVPGAAAFAVAARAALAVQLGCIAAGAVWVAVVVVGAGASSAAALYRALPAGMFVRVDGAVVNPVAILEWVYFGAAMAALAGKSLAELTGWRR